MMKKVSTVIFLFVTIIGFGQSGASSVVSYVTKDGNNYKVTSEATSTTDREEVEVNGVKTKRPIKNKTKEGESVPPEKLVDEIVRSQTEAEKGLEEKVKKKKEKGEKDDDKKGEKGGDKVMEFPDGRSDSEQNGTIIIAVLIKGSGPSISFKNIPDNGIVLNYDNVEDYKSNFKGDVKNELKKKM